MSVTRRGGREEGRGLVGERPYRRHGRQDVWSHHMSQLLKNGNSEVSMMTEDNIGLGGVVT